MDINDLTKEEKLLLEEYKIGMDSYYRSEAIYANRENFFIVAEGFIVAAISQLFLSGKGSLIVYIILICGMLLSGIWYYMQTRSYRFSKVRVNSLKEIETLLSNASIVFGFIHRYEKLLKPERKHKEEIPNWEFRKWLPKLFFILFLFIIFAMLFFSIKQPLEVETSKIVEITDDVGILPMSVYVSDKLDIEFKSNDKKIVSSENYEAGYGWKFVIFDIGISNHAGNPATFFAGKLEDENGIAYHAYNLEKKLFAEPYNVLYPYKTLIDIPSNSTELFTIAYKIPLNVIPEKIDYSINNPDMHIGEIILNK